MKATVGNVRDILATVGPLTSQDLRQFFPQSTGRRVCATISQMHKAKTKQVYIAAWERTLVNVRIRLRPVYALGDNPDAKKPPILSNSERCKRWKAKATTGRGVPNSVWQLGAHL